jgi:hypothetical protein
MKSLEERLKETRLTVFQSQTEKPSWVMYQTLQQTKEWLPETLDELWKQIKLDFYPAKEDKEKQIVVMWYFYELKKRLIASVGGKPI